MLDPKFKKLIKILKPQIIEYLKDNVSVRRFEHIKRVATTAKKYAKWFGFDHNKAELSALLHDIAKEIRNVRLLEIAKLKKISLDQVDIDNPHILHARVGALIAKEKFKIKDEDILGGIRCHTLGEPYMTDITMVVLIADATEPKRDKKKISQIKKAIRSKGLEAAVLATLNTKIEEQITKSKKIHPYTMNARNWIIGEIEKQELLKNKKKKPKS